MAIIWAQEKMQVFQGRWQHICSFLGAIYPATQAHVKEGGNKVGPIVYFTWNTTTAILKISLTHHPFLLWLSHCRPPSSLLFFPKLGSDENPGVPKAFFSSWLLLIRHQFWGTQTVYRSTNSTCFCPRKPGSLPLLKHFENGMLTLPNSYLFKVMNGKPDFSLSIEHTAKVTPCNCKIGLRFNCLQITGLGRVKDRYKGRE